MKTKKLFNQVPGLLHGGDYNPEQWLDRPDILEKDIELMKKAHINVVTLGVFSWSVEEPVEGEFHFDWLEDIMNKLYDNGIYTILATPSAARPAWLDMKYPSAMRCDEMGLRAHHGRRQNHCMTSPEYREKVAIIDRQLSKRFANHPGMLMWHISNELGGYCYCPSCRKGFQDWLAKRYDNDIEKLNKAWWTTFWSHRYTSFDQIDPPYKNGEDCVMGQNLDWKRYSTYAATDFMNFEIGIVHENRPDIPTTTNFMEMFYDYDYHYMCQFIDYISWDNYPEFHNSWESDTDTMLFRAFNHALFRSMKPGQPWMLMESAPGVVNWRPYNKYKRPGIHALSSMQAVAAGSDTVQYFQIRKSRGASEQWHGAVIDHLGTDDTRVFKEVAALGADLNKLAITSGTVSDNKVAILFDWDNRWAINDTWTLANDTKKFDQQCINVYKEFMSLGIEPDIISQDMDWSNYKIIVAPMLYLLHDGVGEKIKAFVSAGGQFMTTYFTGYVDKTCLAYLGGFPGQGLSEVFGLKSEEIDTLYPEDQLSITFAEGKSVKAFDYQELLRDVSAQPLASYDNDYMAGHPAICVNNYGLGKAYYLACRVNQADIEDIYIQMLEDAGIHCTKLPAGIEKHSRYSENEAFDFYLNTTESPVCLSNLSGHELLSDTTVDGDFTLAPLATAVIKH